MYTKFALIVFGWEKTLQTFLYFIIFGMLAGIFLLPVNKEKKTETNITKERTVDVMITRLRQKIEIDPKNPKYFQTIRGSGYVLWIE